MTMLQGAVARPRSANDEQIALRLPKDWIARADKLVESSVVATPGVGVTRSDVLRVAIARGLASLEAEAAGEKPPARPRKR